MWPLVDFSGSITVLLAIILCSKSLVQTVYSSVDFCGDPPILKSTSYQFDDCDHAANLFALSELGNIYTRIMNPTVAVLEDRVSAIEGGVGALGVASGLAASAYAIQNLCKSGDNFISSTHLIWRNL